MKWWSDPHRNLGKRKPGEEMVGAKALRQQYVGKCKEHSQVNMHMKEEKMVRERRRWRPDRSHKAVR